MIDGNKVLRQLKIPRLIESFIIRNFAKKKDATAVWRGKIFLWSLRKAMFACCYFSLIQDVSKTGDLLEIARTLLLIKQTCQDFL